jgi:hypothetical protein
MKSSATVSTMTKMIPITIRFRLAFGASVKPTELSHLLALFQADVCCHLENLHLIDQGLTLQDRF